MVKIAAQGLSDVGKKREKNEDSFLVDKDLGLFIVADGMGGHLGGEFASRLAVNTAHEVFKKMSGDPDSTIPAQDLTGPLNSGGRLKESIRVASQKIFREASRSPNLKGMGTTVVALAVQDGKWYIAHVGDSRAYLVRSSGIQQLTVDHSLVNEQLQAGFITEEEVKNHKLKNIITRSVGFQDDVESDLVVRDLEEGDRFLLCSDGLTNLVSSEEIKKIVSKGRGGNLKSVCQKLISLANERGGDDNVTVVLVAVV